MNNPSARRLHVADILFHDFETFSRVSLPDVGGEAYTRHRSTEALMCSFALNNEPVRQWTPAEDEELPSDLRDMLLSSSVIKSAWNSDFERAVWKNTLGIDIPIEQWRDTQIMAQACSLPASLGAAGKVVDLPEDKAKIKDGKRLMRIFSFPRKPTKTKRYDRVYWWMKEEEWAAYKGYNVGDTETERAMYRKLVKYDMSDEEWSLWHLSCTINSRGIPINIDMVDNAVRVYDEFVARGLGELAELTRLDNPNSNQQFLPWARAHGYPFNDLRAAHVRRGLDYADERGQLELARALELRLEVSKSSPKKYHALARAVDRDAGVIRGAFKFYGAQRTGRWAGTLFQPQNLPRPAKQYEKDIEVHARNLQRLTLDELILLYGEEMGEFLASCIRPCAQAPDGFLFVDADLNAIENRVLGWMAECAKILRVFIEDRDPYIDFATYLYGERYDDILAKYKAGDSVQRTIAKPGVLGCGYMLGAGHRYISDDTGEEEATGLLGYAWNMGVTEFTEEQSAASVETFRREYEEVKDFWYGIERAAKKCIRTGQRVEYKMLTFDRDGPFMRMILPSGRPLRYVRPRIEPKMTPWGEMRDQITYEGLNDKKQWARLTTHPGKLTENADQAISRDLLAHGMVLANRNGADLRLHVHDQLVPISPEDRAEDDLALLRQCMEDQPAWAEGLPLGSAGFVSKVFMKD